MTFQSLLGLFDFFDFMVLAVMRGDTASHTGLSRGPRRFPAACGLREMPAFLAANAAFVTMGSTYELPACRKDHVSQTKGA